MKVNFLLLSLNRNFAGTITALIMQQDIINGYTELHNTSRTCRVKTIFMAMRHKIDDMNVRLASPKALPVRADGRFLRWACHKPSSNTVCGRTTAQDEKRRASRAQRGSLLTPLPRRSRGCGHETHEATPATSAAPKLLVQAERRVKLA